MAGVPRHRPLKPLRPAGLARSRRCLAAAGTTAAAAGAALLLLASAGTRPVAAQISTALTSPVTSPDFTSTRTLLPLVLLCVLLPLQGATLVLLWQRRHRYPIAGRGSFLLLTLNVCFLLATGFSSTAMMLYPEGIPCALNFTLYFVLLLPPSFAYMMRAWILTFRIEIMAFLATQRWREEKRALLAKYAAEHGDDCKNGHKAVGNDAEAGQLTATTTRAAATTSETKITIKSIDVKDSSSSSSGSDTDAIEEGAWFISHRQYTEPRYLRRFVIIATVVASTLAVILAIFDPDVILFDQNFHRRGLLPENESLGHQFTTSGFFGGAPCLAYSIKNAFVTFILGALGMPFLQWVVWRLIIDARRTAARKQDQDAVKLKCLGKEAFEAAAAQSAARIGASNRPELNDAAAVKRELFFVVLIALIGVALDYGVHVPHPEWAFIFNSLTFACLHVPTVILPLYLSYSVSRAHRKLIGKSSSATANSVRKLTAYTRPAHQQPYFSLKFILKNPDTYPVLLAFLQKEFSSENALFWVETRAYRHACKALEAAIPTWMASFGYEVTLGSSGDNVVGDEAITRIGSSKRLHRAAAVEASTVAAVSRLPRAFLRRTPLAFAPLASQSAAAVAVSAAEEPKPSPSLEAWSDVSASPPASGPTLSSAEVALVPMALASPTAGAMVTHVTFLNTVNAETILDNAQPASQVATAPTGLPPPQALRALHAEAARLKAWAQKIGADYLVRSAMYEINIQDDLGALARSQLKQLKTWEPTVNGNDASSYPTPPPFPLSSLYKSTNIAVFDLIQTDSFRRFILTPAFAALLARADEIELARLEHQHDLADETAAVIDKAVQHLTATASNASPSNASLQQQPAAAVVRVSPVSGRRTIPLCSMRPMPLALPHSPLSRPPVVTYAYGHAPSHIQASISDPERVA